MVRPSARWAWRPGASGGGPAHVRVVAGGHRRPTAPRRLPGIVISAGLCGGLLPDQAPGTVVIPTCVSTRRGPTHACDPGVAARTRAGRAVPAASRSPAGRSSPRPRWSPAPGAGVWAKPWPRRGGHGVGCRGGNPRRASARVRVILDTPRPRALGRLGQRRRARSATRRTGARRSGWASTRRATRCGSGRC